MLLIQEFLSLLTSMDLDGQVVVVVDQERQHGRLRMKTSYADVKSWLPTATARTYVSEWQTLRADVMAKLQSNE